MLDRHFAGFLKFFFPALHAAIDWSRQPVFLDKELPKLGPRHLRGQRLADKLAKVWRKDGQPLFVILHSEIQGQPRTDFNERMYVYNYRIADRHNCPVVSLGIVTGSAGKLAVGRYENALWGCRTLFEFPVVKLSAWRGRETELLASGDPSALIVLAQLKVNAARNDAARRYAVKRELTLLLYEHGYSKDYEESLLRFLDWLIRLPEEAEAKLSNEVEVLKGEKPMPYVTSWERRGEKRGRKEGQFELVLRLLKKKFGALDAKFETQIKRLSMTQLMLLAEELLDFSQVTQLESWLKLRPTERLGASRNHVAHS